MWKKILDNVVDIVIVFAVIVGILFAFAFICGGWMIAYVTENIAMIVCAVVICIALLIIIQSVKYDNKK